MKTKNLTRENTNFTTSLLEIAKAFEVCKSNIRLVESYGKSDYELLYDSYYAEERGRALRLQCKFGDMVYELFSELDIEFGITEFLFLESFTDPFALLPLDYMNLCDDEFKFLIEKRYTMEQMRLWLSGEEIPDFAKINFYEINETYNFDGCMKRYFEIIKRDYPDYFEERFGDLSKCA